MIAKKTDIDKIFKKLDLSCRTTKHKYGWFKFEGKKILRVHYSHGKGDIKGKITDKIKSQLKLRNDDFYKLISCPLNKEGYIKILREKKLI